MKMDRHEYQYRKLQKNYHKFIVQSQVTATIRRSS